MSKLKCHVDSCLRNVRVRGYCGSHYGQIMKYGRIVHERLQTDPNEVVFEGDDCRIFLYNKQSEKVAETIIDSEDWLRCKYYKWGIGGSNGYVKSMVIGHLANFILGIGACYAIVPHHKDGNILNNRKGNLEVVSHAYNIWVQKRKKNPAEYRNIYWQKSCGGYIISVIHEKERYYLGFTPDVEKAVRIRDAFLAEKGWTR